MSIFAFQPITRADFPLLAGWLGQPHVARWWADDPSLEAIESDYGGAIDGIDPAQVFIAHRANAPVGLVQRYRIEWYPPYLDELEPVIALPPHAVSMDYLIGPPDALRRGWGTQMLCNFVTRIWLDDSLTPAIMVPVHADNRASWRVLERIGFVRAAGAELKPDHAADNRNHFIYRKERPTAP
jgi:aminoglycoside 6'-N-acetyltransferase